jgi:hypothetical protein
MTDLEKLEYSGYTKRLANQRHALEFARDDVRKAERRVAHWLEEINTTKLRMRAYEEKMLDEGA